QRAREGTHIQENHVEPKANRHLCETRSNESIASLGGAGIPGWAPYHPQNQNPYPPQYVYPEGQHAPQVV
ncbi:hypothetical protein TELCIR_20105, partial [Teladorsagia circumcincta]